MPESPERISNGARPSRTLPSSQFLESLAKWMHVFNRVYRQPMEAGTVWAYREALADLTAEELERGCLEAMRQTRFTPTPAEIREYGILPRTEAPLNALPPAPPMTDAEAREFLAKVRADVPCLSGKSMERDGVIIITDEMRERAEQKKREALRIAKERGIA